MVLPSELLQSSRECAGMAEKFESTAKLSMEFAAAIASELNQPRVEIDHLLIALIEAGTSAGELLTRFGLNGASLRKYSLSCQNERRSMKSHPVPDETKSASPATSVALDRVIRQAAAESKHFKTKIFSEHLLLGIINTEEGSAIFSAFSIDKARLAAEVADITPQFCFKNKADLAKVARILDFLQVDVFLRADPILVASASDLKNRIGDPDLITPDRLIYKVPYTGFTEKSTICLEAFLTGQTVTKYILTCE